MRAIFFVLICGFAAAALLPRNEAEEGWIQIHDGESNRGWTVDAGSGWTVAGGALVADGQTSGYMRSNSAFADFVMRFEVRAAANTKASLIVRAARDGNPKDTGYEIVLGTTAGGDGGPGTIVGQVKSPAVAPPGQWIAYEVEAAGGSLVVRSSGRVLASAGSLPGIAGILLLQSNRGGRVELRNLRLKPLNPTNLFNGNDLSGWKSTGTQPKQGGSKIGKIFGGGKAKPKEVKWTVAGGAIHGEEGPGQLETTAAYGDFILQAAVRMNAKKDTAKKRYALMIRGDAAGLGSGYEIAIQPGASGGLTGLAGPAKALGATNQFVVLTVAAQDRRFQVWADGAPVVDVGDVRPEGTNPKKDARTTPGTIAFYAPEDESNLDIRNVRVIQIAKMLGHTKKAAAGGPAPVTPQQPPPPPPAQPAAGGGANAASEQLKALQEQMKQQQAEKAQEDQKSQKVSTILQQALNSPSPDQQVQLYDQILQLDPNNQVAFNARKDAQAKIDAQRAKSTEEIEQQKKKEEQEAQSRQTLNDSLQKAEGAFLAGNLTLADQSLSAAEKVAPENPAVRALRQRLDAARNRGTSVMVLGGAGAGAVVIAILAWLMRSRRKKDPYVEIVVGLDKGKKYNIDKEVMCLGAIPEDGGAKNDIVLRDVERMVSRFHAQILNQQGKLYIVDLGSSNGTAVDKKRISAQKPIPLKNGSRVTFGGTCTVKIGYEKRPKAKQGK